MDASQHSASVGRFRVQIEAARFLKGSNVEIPGHTSYFVDDVEVSLAQFTKAVGAANMIRLRPGSSSPSLRPFTWHREVPKLHARK
jgi:hypothetical protein